MSTPHIPSARERDDRFRYWLERSRNAAIANETITRKQIDRAKEALDVLSDEERLEIFYQYCRACGGKDPKCQCWNDE